MECVVVWVSNKCVTVRHCAPRVLGILLMMWVSGRQGRIRGLSECIYFVQLIPVHPEVPLAPRYPPTVCALSAQTPTHDRLCDTHGVCGRMGVQ